MAHIQMKTDLIKRIGIFCFRVQTHLREVNFFRYFAAVGTVNQNIRRTSELIQHLHTEIRKSFNFGIADFQNLGRRHGVRPWRAGVPAGGSATTGVGCVLPIMKIEA